VIFNSPSLLLLGDTPFSRLFSFALSSFIILIFLGGFGLGYARAHHFRPTVMRNDALRLHSRSIFSLPASQSTSQLLTTFRQDRSQPQATNPSRVFAAALFALCCILSSTKTVTCRRTPGRRNLILVCVMFGSGRRMRKRRPNERYGSNTISVSG